MNNRNLKRIYDKIYRKGEKKHYSSILFSGDKVPPAKREVLKEVIWKGKIVLDAGCGTGELADLIASKGASRVVGIDYSLSAIEIAKKAYSRKNLFFKHADLKNIKEKFDIIVSLGTLEHMDDPLGALRKLKSRLNPGGQMIITCPNWTNPRGYILMTLFYLYRARITLADLHYLTPIDFEGWAKKLGMKLAWRTIEQEWGHGEKMLTDFKKRLPKVVKADKKKIEEFIEWMERNSIPFEKNTKSSGAVGLYHFRV